DFGALAVKDVTASISDMGEVAARLGSIVTYDKRGDVVDFDNFEEPILKWEVNPFVDAYGRLDSTHAKSGSQSMKLHTANRANAKVEIHRSFAILKAKKLGIEISFSLSNRNCDLWFYFWYNSGERAYDARLKFDPNSKKLYVWDEVGADWVEVADTWGVTVSGYFFHTIKLVVDFDNALYKRLLFDNEEYDISSRTVYNYESVVFPIHCPPKQQDRPSQLRR
ncbi:unnamed protein product, partial [marine sediment metagenome]